MTKAVSVLVYSEVAFDELRDRDGLQAGRYYKVDHRYGETAYAWSPDGVGCYWYDTLEDAVFEHGTGEE